MPGLDFSGNTLNAKIEYWITEGTDDQLLTSYNYERTLGCAYDPNDKQIFPAGVSSEAYLLTAEPAVYTIRFQNTGNDFARDVTLVDNLPAEVDLESFNIVNTSHDVYTSIRDREVTFFFDDIYLIDSLTNAELSQGFVSFEVMFDQATPDFTVIENEAEIYFDFNPAIVTNTVRNTIVEMYPILSTDTPTEKPFVIYPNPTDHSVFFATQQRGNLLIYNLSMKQVAGHEIIESNTKLDLSQLTSGVYYLMFTTEDGEVFNEKLVKY